MPFYSTGGFPMLGNQLKELRKAKGMTGQEMAGFLGVPYVTYGRYERNESSPDPNKLKEFANRLNISIDYLLGNSRFKARIDDYINTFEDDAKSLQEKLHEARRQVNELSSLIKTHEQHHHELEEQLDSLSPEEFWMESGNELREKTIEYERIIGDLQTRHFEARYLRDKYEKEINYILEFIDNVKSISDKISNKKN